MAGSIQRILSRVLKTDINNQDVAKDVAEEVAAQFKTDGKAEHVFAMAFSRPAAPEKDKPEVRPAG